MKTKSTYDRTQDYYYGYKWYLSGSNKLNTAPLSTWSDFTFGRFIYTFFDTTVGFANIVNGAVSFTCPDGTVEMLINNYTRDDGVYLSGTWSVCVASDTYQ